MNNTCKFIIYIGTLSIGDNQSHILREFEDSILLFNERVRVKNELGDYFSHI